MAVRDNYLIKQDDLNWLGSKFFIKHDLERQFNYTINAWHTDFKEALVFLYNRLYDDQIAMKRFTYILDSQKNKHAYSDIMSMFQLIEELYPPDKVANFFKNHVYLYIYRAISGFTCNLDVGVLVAEHYRPYEDFDMEVFFGYQLINFLATHFPDDPDTIRIKNNYGKLFKYLSFLRESNGEMLISYQGPFPHYFKGSNYKKTLQDNPPLAYEKQACMEYKKSLASEMHIILGDIVDRFNKETLLPREKKKQTKSFTHINLDSEKINCPKFLRNMGRVLDVFRSLGFNMAEDRNFLQVTMEHQDLIKKGHSRGQGVEFHTGANQNTGEKEIEVAGHTKAGWETENQDSFTITIENISKKGKFISIDWNQLINEHRLLIKSELDLLHTELLPNMEVRLLTADPKKSKKSFKRCWKSWSSAGQARIKLGSTIIPLMP